MKEIEIDGEKIYLTKGVFGWGVINPVKIDGKINWKNLIAGGSWLKLILVIGFVIIAVGAIFEVSSIFEAANQCLAELNQPEIISPLWNNLK